MLKTLRFKTVALLQLVLVLIFIVFEELIWEGIAKPIYTWVHGLRILQKIEQRLHKVHAGVILVVFVMLLIVVEGLGIYAGVLFVSGNIVVGIMLYTAKIPVAAFTFWLFKISKHKLMHFGWFAWSYTKIMTFIDTLKGWPVYQETMATLKRIKKKIKTEAAVLKMRFFGSESRFVRGMKRFYKVIKKALNRS
jgi:hypothetical protein